MRRVSFSSPRSPQTKRTPFDPGVAPRQLGDLDRLIRAETGEALASAAGRPPDLELDDPRRPAQADVLLQGRRAEGAAASDRAIDRTDPASAVVNGQLDSGTDRRAVGLDAREPQADPVVAVPGVLEQPQRVTVSRCRA